MSSLWIEENQDFERPCMITCALSGVLAVTLLSRFAHREVEHLRAELTSEV